MDFCGKHSRCVAHWQITESCNYACEYCFNRAHLRDPIKVLPVDSIIAALKGTGRKWTVNLVGGEVFLVPGFLSACKALVAADMRIQLETNLSIAAKIDEFARDMDPAHVEEIAVSVHIEERERRNDVKGLIDRIHGLRVLGFKIAHVGYVMHPRLWDRYLRDRDNFGQHDIKLTPQLFVGNCRNNSYPGAYTRKERMFLISENPGIGSTVRFPSRGLSCKAGMEFVNIRPDGDVHRCLGVRTSLGSISRGISLCEEARPCPVAECPCWGSLLINDTGELDRINREFARPRLKEWARRNRLVRPLYDLAWQVFHWDLRS